MNDIHLLGTLADAPILKTTKQGKYYCNFRLNVNRYYENTKGEKGIDVIPCVVWEAGATTICRNLEKGSRIIVHGTLQTKSVIDTKSRERFAAEIVVLRFEYVDDAPYYSTRKLEIDENAYENIKKPEIDVEDKDVIGGDI